MHDLLEGDVALAGEADIAAEGDNVGLGEVDGAVVLEVADVDLDGGSVLGCDNSVSVIAFPGQIDVGKLLFLVDVPGHSGFGVSGSSCFHGDKYSNLFKFASHN